VLLAAGRMRGSCRGLGFPAIPDFDKRVIDLANVDVDEARRRSGSRRRANIISDHIISHQYGDRNRYLCADPKPIAKFN